MEATAVRTLPLLAALPLIVGYGVVEGLWTNRWHSSGELKRAAARLDTVPLTIGEWQGDVQELEPWQVEKAELEGYLMRRYVHATSGEAVTVLLVCGRPGPISLHTPDVCYRGIGYTPVKPEERKTLEAGGGRTAEFWDATLQKRDAPAPDRLHIRWAWSATGEWVAESPRARFARRAALFKLYVLQQLPGDDVQPTVDHAAHFLRLFLPELERRLFDDLPA
jgi:hypothetical protein